MDLKYTLAAAFSLLVIPLIAVGCTDQTPRTPVAEPTAIVTSIEPTTAASGVPHESASVPASVTPSIKPTRTATPKPSTTKTQAPKPVSTTSAAKQTALRQLQGITVAEANYGVAYNRTKDFGPAWADVDHNGCDTRNDILKRDLRDITYRSNDYGCTVATGVLHDPYTGKTINFVRGQSTSTAVQIDHVIPLHYNWLHGAYKWSFAKREAYANDPYVLLAVDGTENMEKSDSGPADWMPSNYAYRCTYVEKFTGIAAKYDISLSRRDFAAINRVLATCK